MVLSDKNISEFQALYKSELGIEISEKDARESAFKLLQLMSIIHKQPVEQDIINLTSVEKDV